MLNTKSTLIPIRLITNHDHDYTFVETIKLNDHDQLVKVSTKEDNPLGIIIIIEDLSKFNFILTQKIRFDLQNKADWSIPCVMIIDATNFADKNVFLIKASIGNILRNLNLQEWMYGIGDLNQNLGIILHQLIPMIQGKIHIEKISLEQQNVILLGFDKWTEPLISLGNSGLLKSLPKQIFEESKWDYAKFFSDVTDAKLPKEVKINTFKKIIINWTWMNGDDIKIKESDVDFVLNKVKESLTESSNNECYVMEQDIGTISLSIIETTIFKTILYPITHSNDNPYVSPEIKFSADSLFCLQNKVSHNKFDLGKGKAGWNGRIYKAVRYGTVSIVFISDEFNCIKDMDLTVLIDDIKTEMMTSFAQAGTKDNILGKPVEFSQHVRMSNTQILVTGNVNNYVSVIEAQPYIYAKL